MSEILEALKEFQRKIDSMKPIATELWFVDRPQAYFTFFGSMSELCKQSPNSFGLYGIRVFNTRSADVLNLPRDRRLAARVFQMVPGVWVLMSDGTVQEMTGRPPTNDVDGGSTNV